MWFSRFVALILGVRGLPWPSPKSMDFPKISDVRCRKGEHSKSFPWTRGLTTVGGIIIGRGIAIGRSRRPVWPSEFVAPTCGVRELLWFPPKLANFLKICDTRYWKGKHFKSFPWIRNLAAVDDITVDRGITMGKDYRFVWLPEFIIPIYSVWELSRFLPKLTNFPGN